MREYLNNFWMDEEGSETLGVLAVIAAAILAIAGLSQIISAIKGRTNVGTMANSLYNVNVGH